MLNHNKKPLKLKILPEAEVDLEDIFLYSHSNWGIKLADSYLNKIYKSLITLLEYPQIGKPKDDILKGCRCFNSQEHLIFYQIVENDIEILRILHKNYQYKNIRLSEFIES